MVAFAPLVGIRFDCVGGGLELLFGIAVMFVPLAKMASDASNVSNGSDALEIW
jgi:hypothetical protein